MQFFGFRTQGMRHVGIGTISEIDWIAVVWLGGFRSEIFQIVAAMR